MKVQQERSRRNQKFSERRAPTQVDIFDHDGFTWRLTLEIPSRQAKIAAVNRFFRDHCNEYPDCDYKLVEVNDDIWEIKFIRPRIVPSRDLSGVGL